MTADRQLACVVISLRSPAYLVNAVRSLLAQDEPVELVVVNSGGGDPESLLRAAGIDVPVITRKEVLYPGGARNLGIEATSAPYVAFLACDCLAEPGWVSGRLRAHRAGAQLVSAPMTNPRPYAMSAVASHVMLFGRRLPGTPPSLWLQYSGSYDRTLFEQYGPFREDLRTGEDTEFRERLGPDVVPYAARDVRTGHRHPTTILSLIRDQYHRGGRTVRAYRMIWGDAAVARATREIRQSFLNGLRWTWAGTRPRDRWPLILSLPHRLLATAAAAVGARLDSARHEGGAPVRTPTLHALLVCRNEMKYLPGYIENISPHVDGIVALDDGSSDGSAEFLEKQRNVLEVVRLPAREPHVWDEPGNRRRLLEAAGRHQPEWLIALDADERVERHFHTRALSAIGWAQRRGVAACAVTLRELWNAPDQYRADGIWGTKLRARLFRWRPDHALDARGHHGTWAPLNANPAGGFPPVDVVIYHLRMIRSEDRAARRRRHEELDPGNTWQEIGYAYLTDTSGIRLERLPPGRDYCPIEEELSR